jgi:hypothetical protein
VVTRGHETVSVAAVSWCKQVTVVQLNISDPPQVIAEAVVRVSQQAITTYVCPYVWPPFYTIWADR